MARAKLAEVEVFGSYIEFRFTNGRFLSASLVDFPDEIRVRLTLHGLEQKLRDAYAGASSPEEAYGLASKVLDTLKSGKWTVRGSAEPRQDSAELLAQAVVAAAAAAGKSLDLATVKVKLQGLDRSSLAKLRSDPRVAAELAKLRGKQTSVLEDLF